MTNRCTLILYMQFILTLFIVVGVGVMVILGRVDPGWGLAAMGPIIAIWLPSPMVDNHLDHLVQSAISSTSLHLPADTQHITATATADTAPAASGPTPPPSLN